ncbi:hypothetical protein DRB96_23490 [Streptomyces sp. ICC1]|nr:hypothetical protein DRB89_23580 [Streptomyces sp. ICC4]AWZ14731.1 hypothetical protein DRB96_23490 [Streptomyces sp. ICC1]
MQKVFISPKIVTHATGTSQDTPSPVVDASLCGGVPIRPEKRRRSHFGHRVTSGGLPGLRAATRSAARLAAPHPLVPTAQTFLRAR